MTRACVGAGAGSCEHGAGGEWALMWTIPSGQTMLAGPLCTLCAAEAEQRLVDLGREPARVPAPDE